MTGQPVIISGAGPAGLAAALTIARAGGRAVVHERRHDVGTRFHGDFQGIENWSTGTDALEELAAIGIEESFDLAPFYEGRFFDPGGREHRYRSAKPLFYLVRRGPDPGTLDRSLLDQAVSAGVEIRFGEARDHLPEGGIVAHGPRAADAIAVGYLFETEMADGAFGVLSDRFAAKGYSYLLVHGGRGTVASCLFDDFHEEKAYLDRTVEFFTKRVGLRMNGPRRFGGAGNFQYPRRARQGSILFAGEAAGFQDALWGFGMRYALISGHLAARSILEGRPERYEKAWQRRLGGVMRASFVNRYAFERLGERGYVALMKRIEGAEDARDWLRTRYAASFWKSLVFPAVQRAVRSRRRETICVQEGCDCTWCRCQGHAPGKNDER